MPTQHSLRVTVQPPSPRLTQPGAVIVKLAGEIGINSMLGKNARHTGLSGDTTLDRALDDALPNPPKLVVLEMSEVTYLSSLGMAALVRFQKRIESAGGELRLAGSTDMIQVLLKRCYLEKVFKMYPDVASAMG